MNVGCFWKKFMITNHHVAVFEPLYIIYVKKTNNYRGILEPFVCVRIFLEVIQSCVVVLDGDNQCYYWYCILDSMSIFIYCKQFLSDKDIVITIHYQGLEFVGIHKYWQNPKVVDVVVQRNMKSLFFKPISYRVNLHHYI